MPPTDAPTLFHETWGEHAALIARTWQPRERSLGRVATHVLDVATPEDPLELELGGRLEHVAVAYEEYGRRDRDGTNTVLVCHALTGSAHAAGVGERDGAPGWWDALIGPGKAIDTDRFHVVSSNVLGGCYGTTGPSSIDPATGRPYGTRFPRYTVRDMVAAQKRLLDRLGVTTLRAVVGGSMGGMQVVEWAATYPEMVRAIVPIAIGARHSAWAIGLNEVARRAITADPAWRGGAYRLDQQPEAGLGLARAIAMLSYRAPASVESRFGRARREEAARGSDGLGAGEAPFQVASYLAYQGEKLVRRFDANTYLYLTLAMDEYDVGAGRGGTSAVLSRLTMPALVIGIDSDVLYPEAEVRELAAALPNSTYARVSSPHGHDAFLIEFGQVERHLRAFLA
ncbi:MAG TPA: homoserine O-acetyltransferase [Trueperaceae bacterium]|nr:homoserine O-acetyltransferase [Trueperaceae bacterium]